MRNIRKILFISLSNLGDIVLTTPVFEKLREGFPDAVIDVVTGPSGECIFAASPSSGTITVRKRRQNMGERTAELVRLRKEKYDLIVDLKNSFLPLLVGAKHRFPGFPVLRMSGHMKDVHLGMIKKLLANNSGDIRFFVPVAGEDKEFVSGLIGKEDPPENRRESIVTVNPGAKSHIKRWSTTRYAELVTFLERKLGCRVFIVGGSEDKETASEILDLSKTRAMDLSGKTSIGALYELIRRSDLFITNDSGPLHLASAAGTPTVAVFGPSNEKKYGPLAPESVVLAPKRECRPCEKAQCPKGYKDGCISEVTADEVFREAKRILDIVRAR